MGKLLDEMIAKAKALPAEKQDEFAELMAYYLEDEGEPEEIPEEHLAAVMEGLAQADRGEFATDEEVREAFRRFTVRPKR